MSDVPRRDPLGPMTMQLTFKYRVKDKEMANAGGLLSNENWRTIAAVLAAGFGLLGTGAALATLAIALLT